MDTREYLKPLMEQQLHYNVETGFAYKGKIMAKLNFAMSYDYSKTTICKVSTIDSHIWICLIPYQTESWHKCWTEYKISITWKFRENIHLVRYLLQTELAGKKESVYWCGTGTYINLTKDNRHFIREELILLRNMHRSWKVMLLIARLSRLKNSCYHPA